MTAFSCCSRCLFNCFKCLWWRLPCVRTAYTQARTQARTHAREIDRLGDGQMVRTIPTNMMGGRYNLLGKGGERIPELAAWGSIFQGPCSTYVFSCLCVCDPSMQALGEGRPCVMHHTISECECSPARRASSAVCVSLSTTLPPCPFLFVLLSGGYRKIN